MYAHISHIDNYYVIHYHSFMPTKKLPTEQLEKLLHQRKCSMLVPLARKLGYALISVRRFLKQIGYFRSYTDNGKWYTLRHTPEFSRDGLWQYKGIGFPNTVTSSQPSITWSGTVPPDSPLARSPKN